MNGIITPVTPACPLTSPTGRRPLPAAWVVARRAEMPCRPGDGAVGNRSIGPGALRHRPATVPGSTGGTGGSEGAGQRFATTGGSRAAPGPAAPVAALRRTAGPEPVRPAAARHARDAPPAA